jgi:hypothetical protein
MRQFRPVDDAGRGDWKSLAGHEFTSVDRCVAGGQVAGFVTEASCDVDASKEIHSLATSCEALKLSSVVVPKAVRDCTMGYFKAGKWTEEASSKKMEALYRKQVLCCAQDQASVLVPKAVRDCRMGFFKDGKWIEEASSKKIEALYRKQVNVLCWVQDKASVSGWTPEEDEWGLSALRDALTSIPEEIAQISAKDYVVQVNLRAVAGE